jgi:hypothetical protein
MAAKHSSHDYDGFKVGLACRVVPPGHRRDTYSMVFLLPQAASRPCGAPGRWVEELRPCGAEGCIGPSGLRRREDGSRRSASRLRGGGGGRAPRVGRPGSWQASAEFQAVGQAGGRGTLAGKHRCRQIFAVDSPPHLAGFAYIVVSFACSGNRSDDPRWRRAQGRTRAVAERESKCVGEGGGGIFKI